MDYIIMFIVNQLPILIAIYFWKYLERVQKVFALFLCWGAIHDSKGIYDLEQRISDYWLIVYILTEVCFYIWVIFEFGDALREKRIKHILLIAFPIFWLFSFFVFQDISSDDFFSGLFDGISAIVISSLAAFSIFKMTIAGKPLESLSAFWFMGGAFFYFFCSVFIFSIMSKEVADGAWMVHRVINTATMMIYAVGFYIAGKKGQLANS